MTVAPRSPWFRRFPAARRPVLRLVAFHHAGGSASHFRTWPADLPPRVEVLAVQLPGRDERMSELPLASVAQVVDELAHHITPWLDLPYVLFGHSLGAMLAFELARAQRRAGRAMPRQLFVSGRWAPQLPDPSRPLSGLLHDEFIDVVRRLGGTPAEVLEHRELMDLIVPTLRADFALSQSYQYLHEPPLDTPMIAFGGVDDPAVTTASVAQWSAQTTAAFRTCLLPGDHFFITSARPALLAEISAALADPLGHMPAR